jgi:uncharacterized protein
MKSVIDPGKFGPWALVTGASSGIGEEFAHQLAAAGLNLVLVARRSPLLNALGDRLAGNFNIQYRVIEADLSEESSIAKIIEETEDIQIGLLISNAGTGKAGKFFDRGETELRSLIQLNAISHLRLTHYFGKKMALRKRGGILLTGAMGAVNGVPYMANEAGTKGYIQSLGKSLHTELKEYGIHITVLVTSPTETPVFYQLGFTRENSPVKPISVTQCVKESLHALSKNKMIILPGLRFRIINSLIPSSVARNMTGKIMKKNNSIT